MPREGAIIFRDLARKLDVLNRGGTECKRRCGPLQQGQHDRHRAMSSLPHFEVPFVGSPPCS
jgi:hypothetical protein